MKRLYTLLFSIFVLGNAVLCQVVNEKSLVTKLDNGLSNLNITYYNNNINNYVKGIKTNITYRKTADFSFAKVLRREPQKSTFTDRLTINGPVSPCTYIVGSISAGLFNKVFLKKNYQSVILTKPIDDKNN